MKFRILSGGNIILKHQLQTQDATTLSAQMKGHWKSAMSGQAELLFSSAGTVSAWKVHPGQYVHVACIYDGDMVGRVGVWDLPAWRHKN